MTQINTNLAVDKEGDQLTYFYGSLPIFHHHIDDQKTFKLFTSQLYVNGSAKQADICRAFGVTSISLKRSVKQLREKGSASFYEEPRRRGAAVLTPEILVIAQELLNEGLEPKDVAEKLKIKQNTFNKAIAAGRLHKQKKTSVKG